MTGCNQWNDGLDVVVEGDAVEVSDELALQRHAAAWPTRVLAFGKGTSTCSFRMRYRR